MIQTHMTGTIMAIEEKLSDDGLLICHGRFQFVSVEAQKNREEVKDEFAFRCKGLPAMAVKECGIGTTGVGQGYIDLLLVQMEGYKDKIPTFVIRNWVSTSVMTPDPFELADAELAKMCESSAGINPENAPRPQEAFAF